MTKADKYIWFPKTGEEQYFRLDTDPNETHNAMGENQYENRISQLRKYLIKELAGCPEGYSDGTKLYVGKEGVASLPHAAAE